MNLENVRLLQICHSDELIQNVQLGFEPYDHRLRNDIRLYEVAAFREIVREGIHKNQNYLGAFSPKFVEKVGIKGEWFKKWIDANPGYDVYFINPFPAEAYLWFNVWENGSFYHPGILGITNMMLKEIKFPLDLKKFPRTTDKNTSFCNYWAGSAEFWERYLHFVEPFFQFMISAENSPIFFRSTEYRDPVCYIPFIIERLFSTFLVLNPQIKYLSYPYTREDIWHRTRALWQHQVLNVSIDSTSIMDEYGLPDKCVREYFDWVRNLGRYFREGNSYTGKGYPSAYEWLHR